MKNRDDEKLDLRIFLTTDSYEQPTKIRHFPLSAKVRLLYIRQLRHHD